MGAEYVLIISMGITNLFGDLPSTSGYQELILPYENQTACEQSLGDFKNEDHLINGHQIFLNAECLPNYDYMEPDLETWQECHDIPEFDKPEYCKEKDFPILDNSDEQG